MRGGSLRHRVRIQQPVTERDSYGADVTTWTDYRQAYASIEQMKAYDKSVVAATWPGADFTITIRYMAGIDSTMRVVAPDGMIYSILGQPNNVDGRNRELILTCQSGVKDK